MMFADVYQVLATREAHLSLSARCFLLVVIQTGIARDLYIQQFCYLDSRTPQKSMCLLQIMVSINSAQTGTAQPKATGIQNTLTRQIFLKPQSSGSMNQLRGNPENKGCSQECGEFGQPRPARLILSCTYLNVETRKSLSEEIFFETMFLSTTVKSCKYSVQTDQLTLL